MGHRAVHGGEIYTGSVRITDDVLRARTFRTGTFAIRRMWRFVVAPMPHVDIAVFDSGFHQPAPGHFLYAIPYEFYEKYRVRRYGAHGITFAI